MQIHRIDITNPPILLPCVATIGNFDGMHLGHQSIIKSVVDKACAANLQSVVITFATSAYEYFHPQARQRIMKLRDKLDTLQQLGVDTVCLLNFNAKIASMSADQFAQTILADKFAVREIIVGVDCRFGKARQGDVKLLREHIANVSVVETLLQDSEKISSSMLRTACLAGDMARVTELRGMPLCVSGHVSYGNQRGRDLAFPTANIFLPSKLRLLHGVYAVKAKLSGSYVSGVANIGSRPTIGDDKWLLEVHFFDVDVNLYGKIICVEIVHKLRSERKFSGLDQLQQQIAEDARQAREFL